MVTDWSSLVPWLQDGNETSRSKPVAPHAAAGFVGELL